MSSRRPHDRRFSTTSEEPAPAVRHAYEKWGAQAYYEQFGQAYENPHEAKVAELLSECLTDWQLDLSDVLDLACGSGEVTRVLLRHGAGKITGIDPYTAELYRQRTGLPVEAFRFDEIAAGALSGRSYSLIACSYALHLEKPSRLPALLLALGQACRDLVIVTPHQRPQIRRDWGWELLEERRNETARARRYQFAWKQQDES